MMIASAKRLGQAVWALLVNLIAVSFVGVALLAINKDRIDTGLALLSFAVLCRIWVVVERGN
jgi:hypothetical protein